MKNPHKVISVVALAVFALASQCVFGAESSVTLQVPFAFIVAGRTMPAGAYTVETSGSVVSVHGLAGTVLVVSGPQSAKRDIQPGLIFTRRGGSTFLVGVRTEDDARTIGSSALQSR